MRAIILKDAIKNFGFKDGFNFWFRWNISDPIKIFYWKYIIGKPLCTHCGYFMCKPDCKHPKIYGRRNIVQYQKERKKKIEKESKTIHKGKDGMCVYCGEEKGQVLIDDPNWDTLERWKVCRVCAKAIEQQRGLAFGVNLTSSKSFGARNLGLEIAKKSQKELDKISYESGKEFSSVSIDLNKLKREKFTGGKNGRKT